MKYLIACCKLNSLDFKNSINSISSVTGMKLDGKNQPHYEEFYFHIFVNLHESAADNIFDKYVNPYLSPKYDDSNMIRTVSSQDIEAELKKVLEPYINSNKFEELKSNTKILPILHGYTPETFLEYAENIFNNLENVGDHIQGIAIAS